MTTLSRLSIIACLSIFSACVVQPEQGFTVISDNNTINLVGGSPFASAYGKVEIWNGSSFVEVETFRGRPVIDPGMETYGSYYMWLIEGFQIPSWAWINNRAQLRISIAQNESGPWFNVYTYDDTRASCMAELDNDPPTHNDWADCAHSSDGVLNICRKGSSWTGSSCQVK